MYFASYYASFIMSEQRLYIRCHFQKFTAMKNNVTVQLKMMLRIEIKFTRLSTSTALPGNSSLLLALSTCRNPTALKVMAQMSRIRRASRMAGVAYRQILTGVSHLQSLFFSVDDDPTTDISMLKETPRMRTVQMTGVWPGQWARKWLFDRLCNRRHFSPVPTEL